MLLAATRVQASTRTMDPRHAFHGLPAVPLVIGVAGTSVRHWQASSTEQRRLKLMPMSNPGSIYDFHRATTATDDSVSDKEKGTGGADATGSYRGKGRLGRAALPHLRQALPHFRIRCWRRLQAAQAWAIWTVGSYYEAVFGRQVQFEGEGSIYSLSAEQRRRRRRQLR